MIMKPYSIVIICDNQSSGTEQLSMIYRLIPTRLICANLYYQHCWQIHAKYDIVVKQVCKFTRSTGLIMDSKQCLYNTNTLICNYRFDYIWTSLCGIVELLLLAPSLYGVPLFFVSSFHVVSHQPFMIKTWSGHIFIESSVLRLGKLFTCDVCCENNVRSLGQRLRGDCFRPTPVNICHWVVFVFAGHTSEHLNC